MLTFFTKALFSVFFARIVSYTNVFNGYYIFCRSFVSKRKELIFFGVSLRCCILIQKVIFFMYTIDDYYMIILGNSCDQETMMEKLEMGNWAN